jgi:hypothetical protein
MIIRCRTCDGHGHVKIVRESIEDAPRVEALSQDELATVTLSEMERCIDCNGTGIDSPDFDTQSVTVPNADPEKPRVIFNLSRTSAVGSGGPPEAELTIPTESLVVNLVALKPVGLRQLARFFDDYASRMENW